MRRNNSYFELKCLEYMSIWVEKCAFALGENLISQLKVQIEITSIRFGTAESIL